MAELLQPLKEMTIMDNVNIKQKLLGAIALLALVSTTESFAQGTTQNLNVTATVPSVCIIDVPTSATQLAFDLSGLATATGSFDQTATLAWRCSDSTALTIELSDGLSNDEAAREMQNGADSLAYNLYTDNTYGTIWDDGTGGAGTGTVTETGQGMNSVGTSDVFGRVPLVAAQNAPVGVYNDNVTVTLTF
jgi:spore coat protein U-like protein